MEDTIIEIDINPGRERLEEWLKEYKQECNKKEVFPDVEDFVKWLNDTKDVEVSIYGSDHHLEFPV